jgi:hypothetical protein
VYESQHHVTQKSTRRSVNVTGPYNVRANIQVNANAKNKVNANANGSFEDFGDVDLDEVIPLSLMVLQQCIDACAAGLET